MTYNGTLVPADERRGQRFAYALVGAIIVGTVLLAGALLLGGQKHLTTQSVVKAHVTQVIHAALVGKPVWQYDTNGTAVDQKTGIVYDVKVNGTDFTVSGNDTHGYTYTYSSKSNDYEASASSDLAAFGLNGF